MKIEGKRVLISGAGRGLGRTLVAAFLAAVLVLWTVIFGMSRMPPSL